MRPPLGGVAGIGTAPITSPVLTLAFGVHETVPTVAVAMLFNNAPRAAGGARVGLRR